MTLSSLPLSRSIPADLLEECTIPKLGEESKSAEADRKATSAIMKLIRKEQ